MDLVVFHVSGLDCAFPLVAIKEIVPMAMLSTPPGMASCMAGFLNLRGAAIPILRLDRLFDLPEQRPGLNTPLIILRSAANPNGVLVGSVRRIVSVTKASFLPLPEKHIFRDCAIASIDVTGDLAYLLSPDCILLDNERNLLQQLQAMEQARLGQLAARL
ncbi:MAG: chemotaxis protein CheW [Candidatus Solibacter usitatus]|nr:chemotaxis protein CheW [Candidatus Solibacter usitatus]